MSDIIKLKDGTTPPTSLGHGEMAINETTRTLFVRTNRGAIDIPLDRMAIEPYDENGTSEVYVYRSSLTAERTELVGGGGGNARDDRTWHIFGNAPQATSTGNPTLQALFEINYPINIRTLRVKVLSGTGSLTLKIYRWTDGAVGELLSSSDVTVTGAGVYLTNINLTLDPERFCASLEGSSGIQVETMVGYLPWLPSSQEHPFTMSTALIT